MFPLPQAEFFTFTCDLITQISYHQISPFLPFKSLFPAPPSSPEWAQISSAFPSVSHSFLFLSLTLRITSTSCPTANQEPLLPILTALWFPIWDVSSRDHHPVKTSEALPQPPPPGLPKALSTVHLIPSNFLCSWFPMSILPICLLPLQEHSCHWSCPLTSYLQVVHKPSSCVSISSPWGAGLHSGLCALSLTHEGLLIQISVLFCLTLVTPALTSEQLLTVSATGVVFSLLLSSVCVHALFSLGAQESALSSPPPTVNRLIFTSALLSFLDI